MVDGTFKSKSETDTISSQLLRRETKTGFKNAFYEWAIDTLAMVTFSTPVAMANEIFIIGMSPLHSLKARTVALPINLLTASPYRKFRNFVFDKFGTKEDSGFFRKAVTDIAAFTMFQLPLYAGIVTVSGGGKHIKAGLITITLISTAIGRPYGAYLDMMRRAAGLPPAGKKKES